VRTSLELDRLAVGPPRAPALFRLSLCVPAGKTAAVVGPSGFGGTTLARTIVGLLRPHAGRILVREHASAPERDITHLPPGERPVGFVPAGGGLLPHLTVAGNILFGLRLRRRTFHIPEPATDPTITALGLQPYLDHYPRLLTDSVVLRVALARALSRAPEAVVVDGTAGAVGLGGLEEWWRRIPQHDRMTLLICTTTPEVAWWTDHVKQIPTRDPETAPGMDRQ